MIEELTDAISLIHIDELRIDHHHWNATEIAHVHDPLHIIWKHCLLVVVEW